MKVKIEFDVRRVGDEEVDEEASEPLNADALRGGVYDAFGEGTIEQELFDRFGWTYDQYTVTVDGVTTP